jgi:hypothetical protein
MQARLVGLLAVALLGSGLARAAEKAPLYTNAQLVSFDARTRIVVVRTNDGDSVRMRLDDHVAGPPGLRAGDRVILGVREQADMPHVSRIIKSTVSPARAPEAQGVRADEPEEDPAVDLLDIQVAQIAAQASSVDSVWNSFLLNCDATLRSRYDRGWFGLWENQVQADLSSGFCRDLYDQVILGGESVKTAMTHAEQTARRSGVWPGEIRDVKRRYAMSWEGWGLPAPALRREP